MHNNPNLWKFLSSFDLVIFDLDGVIIDSGELKVSCMKHTLDSFDTTLVESFLKEFRKAFGQTRQYHFKRFYNDYLNLYENFNAFYEQYAIRYATLLKNHYTSANVCDYAAEIISKLSNEHIKLYVVTGTNTQEAIDVLQANKLYYHFKGVFGSPSEKRESIAKILSETKNSAKKTILIGDAIHDRDSAIANNISFLFVEQYSFINIPDIIVNYDQLFYSTKNLSPNGQIRKYHAYSYF